MRSTVSTSSLLATIVMGMLSPAFLSPSLNPLGPLVSDWKNPTAVSSQDDAGNKLKQRQMFLSCMEAGKRAVAMDDLHAALKHFSEACEINPAIAESHNNLGNVLLELGEVTLLRPCLPYCPLLPSRQLHIPSSSCNSRLLPQTCTGGASYRVLRQGLGGEPEALQCLFAAAAICCSLCFRRISTSQQYGMPRRPRSERRKEGGGRYPSIIGRRQGDVTCKHSSAGATEKLL